MSADDLDSATRDLELAFVEPVPAEVDAGAVLTLAVRVTALSGFDSGNAPFLVTASGEIRLSGELPGLTGAEREVARIAFVAPAEVGEFACALVIPEHDRNGETCRQASLPFALRTRAHVTSLAVWDGSSPVVIGETFRLKVGAQCSAACASLQGQAIEIRDQTQAVLARAPLSATPWPGTDALYWAEVELAAPSSVGQHTYTAKLASAGLHLPHGEAAFAFSLIADPPPDHAVTVTVVEVGTQTPIDDAQVRLGAYRTSTDAMGRARFAVPKGEHELSVWKAGYEAPARMLEVSRDAGIQVAAEIVPAVNPDSYWQG